MDTTLRTADQLDRIASQLDAEAREDAHAVAMESDRPMEERVAHFASSYLIALAYRLGERSAEQCARGEKWDPAEILSGDREMLEEHAALVGVELDADAWRTLFRHYAD